MGRAADDICKLGQQLGAPMELKLRIIKELEEKDPTFGGSGRCYLQTRPAAAQGPDGKLELRTIQELEGKDATFGKCGR